MIFIFAGHHLADPGAVANGYQENNLAIDFTNLLAAELTKLNAPFKRDNNRDTLAQVLSKAQTGSGSVVLECHFNAAASAASGIEVLVSDYPSKDSMNFAYDLVNNGSKILGIPNRGVKTESQSHRGRLGLMRESGIVALAEIGFITNMKDVEAYQNNKKALAANWANILKQYDALRT